MKFKEIQSMSEQDKKEREIELKKELMKLYAQVATGSNLESPGRVSQIKKTLAKIQTSRKLRGEKTNK
ncbi:50S ribosomal protein L29 [Candidatus Woesearchaeota archaeon]|nr:50S ribosomal protein L29 [Candidatus Woesearchaeota archaeon]MBW3017416.1 50S ribosomal protein L29 [Candidatus Woesearchaeota archaeon]